MRGAGERQRLRRPARRGVRAFRSPLVSILAALALVLQLLVLPYHQALSAPAATNLASVAAELKATFGDAAALCVQADDRGRPSAPEGGCDDRCPLCQLAAQAAALAAPDLPALPERLDADCRKLGLAAGTGAISLRSTNRNRARAPPAAV